MRIFLIFFGLLIFGDVGTSDESPELQLLIAEVREVFNNPAATQTHNLNLLAGQIANRTAKYLAIYDTILTKYIRNKNLQKANRNLSLLLDSKFSSTRLAIEEGSSLEVLVAQINLLLSEIHNYLFINRDATVDAFVEKFSENPSRVRFCWDTTYADQIKISYDNLVTNSNQAITKSRQSYFGAMQRYTTRIERDLAFIKRCFNRCKSWNCTVKQVSE